LGGTRLREEGEMTALLFPTPITGPVAATVSPTLKLPSAPRSMTIEAALAYGSDGTTIDAYVQTSLDGGVTWVDIANFHFTTAAKSAIYNLCRSTPKTTEVVPTDCSLASDSAVDGVLGPWFRVKYQSSGTYVGSTLRVDIACELTA
jgi:hypothetical protein